MFNRMYWMGFLIIGALLISGCDAAFVSRGRIIGLHSGQFVYSDGYLRVNYKFPLDTVWNACEKTVVDMKGFSVEMNKEIAKGTIKAIIQDEEVTITVEYESKDVTTVSILVGITGNNIASQLIHEKIGFNLQKLSSAK